MPLPPRSPRSRSSSADHSPGIRGPRWPSTLSCASRPAWRSTFATRTAPGSAARTRTPVACCASTSPRAPTSAGTIAQPPSPVPGQCRRRELLRRAKERTRLPPAPTHAGCRSPVCLRVHRGLLQSSAPPLRPRLPLPGRVRSRYAVSQHGRFRGLSHVSVKSGQPHSTTSALNASVNWRRIRFPSAAISTSSPGVLPLIVDVRQIGSSPVRALAGSGSCVSGSG